VNTLVKFLSSCGYIGKENAIVRRDVANTMCINVREVRALSEEARLAGEFIGYSTDSNRGGLYLAGSEVEREEIAQKVRRECLSRLRQYSALKRKLYGSKQLELFAKDSGVPMSENA